ncbi:hypothetical protein Tco_0389856 [Tanacetum coccineum]
MEELTFFLGLQVKQKEDGIFISQDKYVGEILKKFGFCSLRIASTPMETNKALTRDEDGEDVDAYLYRSMIGSLMYLTSSRPDIMFSVCACSRFQDFPLILEAFLDSDYAGASLNRKSTTVGKRGWDTKIPQSGGPPIKVGNEVVHKELGDRMERTATTASSLEAEQDNEGSAGFHQIVDFLNSTHIKYALTKNPTIYVSLIYQFWQTTFASTSKNREMEITATIDGRVKTVTEASIRRHLKLEDSDGISTSPNTKIFEQLALMG